MSSRDYWQPVISFGALLEQGMIDARDAELFHFAADADEAWAALAARGIGSGGAP